MQREKKKNSSNRLPYFLSSCCWLVFSCRVRKNCTRSRSSLYRNTLAGMLNGRVVAKAAVSARIFFAVSWSPWPSFARLSPFSWSSFTSSTVRKWNVFFSFNVCKTDGFYSVVYISNHEWPTFENNNPCWLVDCRDAGTEEVTAPSDSEADRQNGALDSSPLTRDRGKLSKIKPF